METIYNKLVAHEGDYNDLLEKLNLLFIFGPIIDTFNESPETAKAVIRFLAYAYSKDSEYILSKDKWISQKLRCAKAANLNDRWHQQVVYLEATEEYDTVPDIIKGVAIKYLAYQNDANNEDLKSLYDLHKEMIVAAASALKDANGLIDYEQKYKCRKYANEIKQWIREAEDRMKQEDTNLRAAKEEIRKKTKVNKSWRVENYAAGSEE